MAIHDLKGDNLKTTGKIKFFNEKKNYGFITTDNGDDIFLHPTDVQDTAILKTGTRVSFNIGKSQKGVKAVDVTLSE